METQLDINNSLYLESLLIFGGTSVPVSVIKYTTCHLMTIMTSIKKVTNQIMTVLRIRETNYCQTFWHSTQLATFLRTVCTTNFLMTTHHWWCLNASKHNRMVIPRHTCSAVCQIVIWFLFISYSHGQMPSTFVITQWHRSTAVCDIQALYRNLTVVFHDFPGQNYFIFQTFQGVLYLFI